MRVARVEVGVWWQRGAWPWYGAIVGLDRRSLMIWLGPAHLGVKLRDRQKI